MSPANDNSGAVRDLGLGGFALVALMPGPEGVSGAVAGGGFDHAAIVTLRGARPSSGKCAGSTGSNLRAAPFEINAVAGALAAMLNELPVRGGILDRLS